MAMISQTDQMEVIGLVRVQIIIKFLNGGMVIGLGHTVKGEISIGVRKTKLSVDTVFEIQ